MRKDDNSVWQGCPADAATVQIYLDCWGYDKTISLDELEGKDFVIYDGEDIKAITAQDVVNDYIPLEQQYYNTPNPFGVGGPTTAYFDVNNVCSADYFTDSADDNDEEDYLCL